MKLNKNSWPLFAVSGPVLAVILVLGFFVYSGLVHKGLRPLTIDGNTAYVSVADNETTRQLGLGGREGLAADEGMLFIFPVEGQYPFWMKDMLFSIDIIWIANDGTIIYIQPDVVPSTYPETYAPSSGRARYVLELPAGYTREHTIQVGDKVSI